MLVVVKMPHTEPLTVTGTVPDSLLKFLTENYGENNIESFNDEEGSVGYKEMDWYKETKATETPGKNLRFFRDLCGMTQKQLAEKLGTCVQNISNMENDRRAISRETAKKLASLFRTSPANFL